jgi:hypothetical protein
VGLRGGEFVCDGALDQIEDLKGNNGELGSLKVHTHTHTHTHINQYHGRCMNLSDDDDALYLSLQKQKLSKLN